MKVASCKDSWKSGLKEYTLMVAFIILGIAFMPIVVILYCIPSIRKTFKQLAYEDAMRG